MAGATPTLREARSPPQTGTSADTGFTDSAIMDMTTPTISPQSKPEFETDQCGSEVDTGSDEPDGYFSQRLGPRLEVAGSSNENKTPQDPSEAINSIITPTNKFDLEHSSRASSADSSPAFSPDPELISHLSTTVSSLRLRHQEQAHLQTLFTSKLEALAQRSLEQEATIRSLTAELQSLRNSNTHLGRENATLTHENHDLRKTAQDMKSELLERDTAMEAMAGAVRGLEGWIESANHSPRSNPPRRLLQDQARHRRERREVIRGHGRFRGRYHLDGNDETDANGGSEAVNTSKELEPTEIQEGVMAWVRGFRDVEEGLKARRENDGRGTAASYMNGRPPESSTDDTKATFDEDFGDFETGG